MRFVVYQQATCDNGSSSTRATLETQGRGGPRGRGVLVEFGLGTSWACVNRSHHPRSLALLGFVTTHLLVAIIIEAPLAALLAASLMYHRDYVSWVLKCLGNVFGLGI